MRHSQGFFCAVFLSIRLFNIPMLNITYVALYLYPAPMYLFAFGAVVVFIYSADFNSCHFVPEQWINKLSTFDCGATAREEQKTNIYAFHVDCLFDSRKLFEIGLCVCFWRDEINEKKTSFGKYCTQMANAINLHSRTFAYVIWIDLASETVRTFNLKRTSPTTSHWCNTYASIQAHRFLFAENDRAKKGIAKNAIVSAYY